MAATNGLFEIPNQNQQQYYQITKGKLNFETLGNFSLGIGREFKYKYLKNVFIEYQKTTMGQEHSYENRTSLIYREVALNKFNCGVVLLDKEYDRFTFQFGFALSRYWGINRSKQKSYVYKTGDYLTNPDTLHLIAEYIPLPANIELRSAIQFRCLKIMNKNLYLYACASMGLKSVIDFNIYWPNTTNPLFSFPRHIKTLNLGLKYDIN